MGEVEELEKVEEPKWFIELISKVSLRKERQFVGFFFPLICSMIESFALMIIIIGLYPLKELYQPYLLGILYLVSFIFMFLLMRKYYVLKGTEYDRFDLFALSCGKIGLDLKRLLLVTNFNHNLIPNVDSLITNGRFIRLKNYKTQEEKHKRKSLTTFLKLSLKLMDFVENVEANREAIKKLSNMYLSIGKDIESDISRRINFNMINLAIDDLKLIKIEKKVAYVKLKSLVISKKMAFLIILLVISSLGACITYYITSDNNTTILVLVGLVGGLPAVYVALNSLPGSKK